MFGSLVLAYYGKWIKGSRAFETGSLASLYHANININVQSYGLLRVFRLGFSLGNTPLYPGDLSL